MLPLEGTRVLDLTRFLPGPYCAMILADMGADVTRVEEVQPRVVAEKVLGTGDSDPDKTVAYNFLNRNKKSIAINLKEAEGRRIFHRLAETADVVVEEFRPGVSRRLGVDYDTLSKINSRLIYCAITGYGQDGPYANIPGHDPNYLGVAGVLGITGTADGQYVLPGIPIGDVAGGGMQGAIGVLCALMARQKTGKGQFVDISMTDGIVSMLAARHGQTYFASGKQPKPGDRPAHVYRTKDDKHIVVAPAEPHFWERLCKALALERYIPYHRDVLFFTPEGGGKRAEVIAAMSQAFLTRTRDEWFRLLAFETDTCASPCYDDFDEVFSDPHLKHRQMIVEMDHPRLGKVKQVGIPIKLSDTPGRIRSLPPRRGENTDGTLIGLGYSRESIKALRDKGIVL